MGKILKINALINDLNRFCFFQRPISFIFKSDDQKDTICRDAVPQPCVDDQLTCVWLDDGVKFNQFESYSLHSLQINDTDKWTVVTPQLNFMDETHIRITLPETGMEMNSRTVMRHPCDRIALQIERDGTVYRGELLDFHANAFKTAIARSRRPNQPCFIAGTVWKATLAASNSIIYSGDVLIVRESFHLAKQVVVLSPVQSNIPTQKAKRYRCERVKPVPSLHIHFRHPLTGNMVSLDVNRISGSGFSVGEDAHNAVLLPGMLIPSLALRLANIFSIKCSARVVHRRLSATPCSKGSLCVCGIVFTDMCMRDHTRLVAFLQQIKDQRTLICNSPNMNALWDFFFDTGFLYPKKYQHLYAQQSSIKKTFEKLYLNHPNTSRHLIFQENGVINGLIALQRVYKYTWLMHHLAARTAAIIAGPKVLNQAGSYLNESHCLNANRMKYAIVYFRPENKFPNIVFGGVARHVKDPRICSLDTFAYFHVAKSADCQLKLKPPLRLTATTHRDLEALAAFYKTISGGLMLEAFDLVPDRVDDDELAMAYQQAGLRRELYLYTFKKADTRIAIIMVQLSDIGINLSDLTNCIHVFLLNPKAASKKTLQSVLFHLARKYNQEKIAINVFPADDARELALPVEKRYTLWTLDMQYSDHYFGYLKRLSHLFKH